VALFLRDLRFGARALRRSPWYALTIVGVLAIGMGLTAVAFAVTDGVLFKALPYAQSTQLYLVRPETSTAPKKQVPPAAWREIDAWRQAITDPRVSIFSHGSPQGTAIDEQFFDVLGVQPLIGGFSERDFAWFAEAERTGQRVRPVLLSYARWLAEFGGDHGAIGRTIIQTNREGFVAGIRIAGVLPKDFVFPLDIGEAQPDMVAPIPHELRRGSARSYYAITRLQTFRPEEIGERLTAAVRNLSAEAAPPGHAPVAALPFDQVGLVPLTKHLARHERPALALVVAASGLLLMLACVNVAGLAGARNVERGQSLQIRTALGASPGALIRELIAEMSILTLAAAGIALLLARPLLVWTMKLLPATVTLLKTPAIDGRVFAGAAATTMATMLLVSLWPAWTAARIGRRTRFHESSTASPVRRFAKPLVSAQIAAGFVLLVAGGLTLSSLAAAWRNDTGYRRAQMLLLEASVNESTSRAETAEKLQTLPLLVQSVEGVDAVAMSTIHTMFARQSPSYTNVIPEGWTGEVTGITSRQVSANYFEVMGIRLVDGRWPAAGEWNEPRLAIISETAARLLWPDRPAIGRTLVWRTRDPRPPLTVIGVVADARYAALDADPSGDIYLPSPIGPGRYGLFFHVRTTRSADAVLGPVLTALSGRGYRIDQAATHEDALFASVKHRALPAWLFGSLGVSALVVLGTGIFGLLAMSAAQRTREIGIRLALGATRVQVVSLFLREQFTALAIGLTAGGLFSLWGVRFLESRLYGVNTREPLVWLTVTMIIAAVALVATLVPALKAVRCDPIATLKAE
jgi:predicted permease